MFRSSNLSEEFDRSMGYDAAIDYLKKGVEYFNRETDPSKGYGNSATVDVTTAVDAANFKRISVRGTLAEGNMMISRINFDKLTLNQQVQPSPLFIKIDRGLLGKLVSLWQRALIFTICEILMILVVIIP